MSEGLVRQPVPLVRMMVRQLLRSQMAVVATSEATLAVFLLHQQERHQMPTSVEKVSVLPPHQQEHY